jgi:hypothetical protein
MLRRVLIVSRRALSLALLLAGVVILASGCVVAPVGPAYGGYGYGPVYGPPVVVAPPPVVFGWGWGGGWYRGRHW